MARYVLPGQQAGFRCVSNVLEHLLGRAPALQARGTAPKLARIVDSAEGKSHRVRMVRAAVRTRSASILAHILAHFSFFGRR